MIPVYVNTFNRLTTTERLCHQIARLDNARPVIIDNASIWGPLLDWYADCPYDVIRLRDNMGHHAPWLSGVIEQDAAEWYVVTDCDLDIDGVPLDCLQRLREPFDWPGKPIIKSGLSLRIDDVPKFQTKVLSWEPRFWKRQVPGGRFYWAQVDTTFALYRGSCPYEKCMQVVQAHSVRSAPPYTARHVPWYLDGDNLDEENRHYFATANESNSWRPNGRQLVAPYQGGSHAPRRV
jgi:hypothetical protein